MLVGVVAFNVLKVMNPADTRAVGVLVLGYFFQGNFGSLARSKIHNGFLRNWIFYDLLLPLHLHHSHYVRKYVLKHPSTSFYLRRLYLDRLPRWSSSKRSLCGMR